MIPDYATYFDQFGHLYFNKRIEKGLLFNEYIEIPAITQLINSFELNTESRVLDIGCAFGSYSKFLAEKEILVTSIDVSEQMVVMAKKYCEGFNNIEFIHSDFLTYDFKGKKFDLILGSFMLGYFHDLNLFFDKIKSISASKGCIVLSMLHPIIQSKVSRIAGEGILINNYFEDKTFESNYLKDDKPIQLKKWTFGQIFEACSVNSLIVENLLEPKPVLTANVSDSEIEFFSKCPSVAIFVITRRS